MIIYNIELRSRIKSAGFFNYEIAAKMGIAEYSFSKMLSRSELDDEKKAQILAAIRELIAEREVNINE